MKMKLLPALALILCLVLPVGCSGGLQAGSSPVVSNNMTAEETVRKFFEYWNGKDEQGMRSLMYEEMPHGDWQLDLLNSVTLDSCAERKDIDKSDWYEPWHPNPYDFICVDAEFTIDAKAGHVLPGGAHAYGFWLVKESKDAGWIIVSYGQG